MPQTVLALGLLLAGCQLFSPDGGTALTDAPPPPPTSELSLSAELSADARTVDLVLTNRTENPVGYNLCGTPLQDARTGAVRYNPALVCTMELLSLAPGASALGTIPLSGDWLPAGSYRARATVFAGDTSRIVLSDPIRIE